MDYSYRCIAGVLQKHVSPQLNTSAASEQDKGPEIGQTQQAQS